MAALRRVSLVAALVMAGAGCGLVYDLSKLGPGDGDGDGGADAAGADALANEAGPRACPTGPGSRMIDVDGKFCIDAHETTNADYAVYRQDVTNPARLPTMPDPCKPFKTSLAPGSNLAAAQQLPVVDVDWCDAWLYCKWAGKRLCGKIDGGPLNPRDATSRDKSEWARACNGKTFAPGSCNTPGDASAPLRSSTTCESDSPAGIFDLVGNVSEWVDSCASDTGGDDECEVLGGSYLSTAAEATCASIEPVGRKFQRADHGIRCCATP